MAANDGGDAMSTINPDDIAQITLLKGASAAALYGAVAANGAIMITTKSAQAGKVAINVSSNTTVESAMSLPKFQNNYGMSDEGTFSWGSKLELHLRITHVNSINRVIQRITLSLYLVERRIFLLISLTRMSHRMVLCRRMII